MNKIFTSICLIFLGFTTYSQTIVSWNFGTASANPSPSAGLPISNLLVSDISSGNNNGTTTLLTTTSASSGYTGASGQYNAGAAARIGTLNTAASGSAYFEFTLTPSASTAVTLSQIDFGSRSTSTGPQAYSVRSSLDGFANDFTSGVIANNSAWSLKTNTVSVVSGAATPLVIRIYGHSGSGTPSASTANWRIDDLSIIVTVNNSGPDLDPPLIGSLFPANNATDVNRNTSLSITFNESVQKGTGNIYLKKFSDNSIVQTLDITSSNVTVTGSNTSISINPLDYNTPYYVEIDAGAIEDLASNDFAGITGNSTWKFTTGSALFTANFNTCSSGISDGFTQFSATGAQLWACTNFGRDANNMPLGSAPSGIQINGFNVTNIPNEDWLISPSLDLSTTTYPLLSYYSRTKFNGQPLQLKVSTDYPGSGDPRNYTWTDIDGRFPSQTSDAWTLSQYINLAAFKSTATFVAFVYISTDEEGARWTLDDFRVDNSLTPPPPMLYSNTTDLPFGYVAVSTSAVKTFTFTGNDLTGDVTLTATGNFLLSKTNGGFTTSISYTQAEANNLPKTVYVQFIPPANSSSYTGTITISTPGVSDLIINTSGNSIDAAITLEVVNWNIEWFGSIGNGPADDNLQEQNVKTILQTVGADVYGLTEIVSEPRLSSVVSQMPGYAYVLSNYGSHTNTSVNPPSNLAEAQKLAFIYKTSVLSNVTAEPLLSQGINSAADITNPAYNYFASGRFPYMLTADVTLDGITKSVRFILIHGKANTSPTSASYARRKSGSDTLQFTLNTLFPNDNIVILGDFNDDLDSTITDGINPKITSYSAFMNNSNYGQTTLSLSLAGKKSTVSYNDMIDHVILSNDMSAFYLNNSATVLSDVTSLVTAYSSTTSDHYPVFTRYAFDPVILPVTLLSFNAFKQTNTVKLEWSTSQEINSKWFEVEKSVDGIHWTPVQIVPAAGNSQVKLNYVVVDINPAMGINYYRLKQIDQDNRYAYSETRTVLYSAKYQVSLAPNPASDFVNVLVTKENASHITIQVVDMNGRVVAQLKTNQGMNRINTRNLSKGTYSVKVLDGFNINSVPLIIR